jgi:subtilisin-like proprotein convertase family protein
MKKALLFFAMALVFSPLAAQKKLSWQQASAQKINGAERIKATDYSPNQQLLEFDIEALKQSLANVADKSTGSAGREFSLPTMNGTEKFMVWETSNFAPALRVQFPEIKSFVGTGITDPHAYLRFSLSPDGIETMILRADKGAEFIEPFTTDRSVYVMFDSKSRVKGSLPFTCHTEDTQIAQQVANGAANRSNNQIFKTYRLALSCTGEYTTYFGGTVAGALAGMNATMTRVNGVLDMDLAVKLEIIPNNTSVIYTNAASDPYSSAAAGSGGAWNAELQNALTNVLGNAAYDIGHLFGASGGGGNAGCIGCICVDDTASTTDKNKGSGFTSPADGIPMGDNFDIDFVVHEMGHQMGANHTFSYAVEGTGVNVETGSGVTIMGYAGVTGGYDVQAHSIPYYAYRSILQIQTNLALAAHNCSVNTPLTNSPPTVSAGLDYTIPMGTAFVLHGTGSDVDGDALTYMWEQNDNGTSATTGANSFASATKTVGPTWRTFDATSSPDRYFPQLSSVLAGVLYGTWESVSDVARTLNFTFTARDHHPNGGQTGKDANIITVSASAGPFEITAPSGAGVSWAPGSTQTITWAVNNTTILSGSATVNLRLSIDGGATFPYVLATNTPNDGSETITVPSVAAQSCRIWIEPTGNVYYAVNDVALSIGYDCNAASVSPNTPIADGLGANTPGATATSMISVNATGTVSNMKVNFATGHTWVGDLVVKISHPDGTQRTLWNRTCNNPQVSGINMTFQDGAGAVVCASPVTGTYNPVQTLAIFNGKPTNGNWTLSVQDFYNGDTGNITSWGVDFGCTLGNPGFDQSDFAIYPNPNSGNFAVQYTSPVAGDVTISVHDIRGRKVFENKYSNTGLFYQNIQLENAETGIYLVTVQDSARKIVKKVLVK